ETQRSDIWVIDLVRGAMSRLTSAGHNFVPVWTPDGKRLIYGSGEQTGRVAFVSASADGSPPPTHAISAVGQGRFPESVSPDGKLVIGRNMVSSGTSGNDFWVLPLTEGSSELPSFRSFLDNRFRRFGAQFSPDGEWVAYASGETGSNQIYIT